MKALTVLISIILISNSLWGVETFEDPVRDRKIIMSVIGSFATECTNNLIIDKITIEKLNLLFSEEEKNLTYSQNNCFINYMSQINGIFKAYKELCQSSLTGLEDRTAVQLSQLFVNINRYLTALSVEHKKMNSCLLRANLSYDRLVQVSDYSHEARNVFNRIRSMKIKLPFREEGITFR